MVAHFAPRRRPIWSEKRKHPLQGHNPGVTTASTGIYGTDMLSRRIIVLFSVADCLNSISGISATCRLPLLLPAFVQQIDGIPQRLVSNSQITLGRG
jgi:hypothetical protein